MQQTFRAKSWASPSIESAVLVRGGWTLFELLVVLALLGLVSSAGTLTLKGVLSENRERADVDMLLLCDRVARSEARRYQRSLQLRYEAGSEPSLHLERPAQTARSLTSWKLITMVNLQILSSGKREPASLVSIDARGRSPTYLVELESAVGDSTWIVLAGETGQPIFGLTTEQINALAKKIR